MIDKIKSNNILENDPKLKAIFDDTINQVFFTKLVDEKIYDEMLIQLKEIIKHQDQISELVMSNLDELRNILFREGICFDNSCLVNIAYDLDEVICNENWNLLTEIIERLEYRKTHGGYCQGCQFKLKNNFDDTNSLVKKCEVDDYFKVNGFKTKKLMELDN